VKGGLDGRHRWEVSERKDASVTYTCRACGRTQTFELLVPDAVVDELIRYYHQPNPWLALFGR
jgi:hypothetical protein